MTRGERFVSALCGAYLIAALSISSCAGQSAALDACKATAEKPNACLYSQLANQLEGAAGVHYETMKAAGRLNASGTISDTELEVVRTAGKRVEHVLRIARSALAAARAAQSDAPFGAFADVQEALADLTNLMADLR